MSFEIRLAQFNGPLHKLLELIEAKELDITLVSLAKVTGDFIAYVQGLEGRADSIVLSDFVAVASKLLLIKSKVLLPNLEFTQDEEEDIAELEKRLEIYRLLCSTNPRTMKEKSAAYHINLLWNKNQISGARKLLASLKDKAIFYPPENTEVDGLGQAMRQVLNVLERIFPEKEEVSDNIVTLSEKIEELVKRLNESSDLSFGGSFKEEDKTEIVVLFLAVLHMLSSHLAEVEQESHFGDIRVRVSK